MSEKREHLNTQKVYPTVNNEDLLEFRVPANSKGQLDLSNVTLHFNQLFTNYFCKIFLKKASKTFSAL